MRICIGGRNNIAVEVCKFILNNFPKDIIYAIPGRHDNGIDGYQRSFLKFLRQKEVKIVALDDIYDWDDLIFLSLEFDRIIRPSKFKSDKLFNIHFSLLPAYKGMYTSALPILYGETYSGVTLHCIDSGIDTGSIIDQEKFLIPDSFKSIDLYEKCTTEGIKLVIKNLQKLLGDIINSVPQPIKCSSYYSTDTLDYKNISINFHATAFQIDCQVRAYAYRPFQLPEVGGNPIFYTKITDSRSVEKPGSIISETEESFLISSIDYDIILYKDRLPEIIDCSRNNDLERLKKINHIKGYINEREITHGWTPLIVAAYHNNINVIRYLVENGADVNGTNYNGTTVIMYAKDACLKSDNYDSIGYLLAQGADPNICDNSGKNLFDYIDCRNPTWNHIIKFKKI